MPYQGARSLSALFSDGLIAALGGTRLGKRVLPSLFGAVYPPQPPPPAPTEDARGQALEALADYLAEIVYQVPQGTSGQTQALRLQRDRIFTEWPDDANTQQLMPSIEFLPGIAEANAPGLTPTVDEASYGIFGPGTALVPQHEHVEQIRIEARATTRSQRHLILAGLEQALQPDENLGCVRLITGHYGQPARFRLVETERTEDEDSARRRRKGMLTVEVGIDVVRLVRVAQIQAVQVGVTVVPHGSNLPTP